MKRFVPAPLLSAALFVLWLALNRSVDAGQVLLGIAVALGVPVLSAPLRPATARIHNPLAALRLIVEVLRDVVVSNLLVARGILSGRRRAPRSAFVTVPLDLRDAHGLAALAIITTIVPGTVWSELSLDRRMLLLHVFDVDDEAAFIGHFKARYERPLREIFE